MNTELVMCIVFTSTNPSCTPLFVTASRTCGVMFTKAILLGMLSVRYSVWAFMDEISDLIPLLNAVQMRQGANKKRLAGHGGRRAAAVVQFVRRQLLPRPT